MTDHAQVRLGKRPAKHDPRTLRLAAYLPAALPEPPVCYDWTRGHAQWGMMRNDQLGDCTIAAVGHAVQVFTANTAAEVTEGDVVVEGYYRKWAGYNPADPSTDRGAYELDVLNAWRKEGFNGHALRAYAAVNPLDATRVRQAIGLFGGLYIGLALPTSAMGQKIWDVAARDNERGSWGGHAVFVCGYDADMLTCITWGELQRMTWRFLCKYCDECYALLAEEWMGTIYQDAFGHNLAALENDLRRVTARTS